MYESESVQEKTFEYIFRNHGFKTQDEQYENENKTKVLKWKVRHTQILLCSNNIVLVEWDVMAYTIEMSAIGGHLKANFQEIKFNLTLFNPVPLRPFLRKCLVAHHPIPLSKAVEEW